MTDEQEKRLDEITIQMNLSQRERELARAIVDAVSQSAKDKHGEFAPEKVIQSSAVAQVKYLETEGFTDQV